MAVVESSEADPALALFEGKLNGLVVALYENERPLQGLVGLLDWHFHGAISNHLRTGAIKGAANECSYVPMTKGQKTFHLILAGCGRISNANKRGNIPLDTLKAVQKNLVGLKLQNVGISKNDLKSVSEETINRIFKDTPVWIVA